MANIIRKENPNVLSAKRTVGHTKSMIKRVLAGSDKWIKTNGEDK